MRATLIEGASTAYGMDAGEYGGWVAQLHRDRQAYNARHRSNPQIVINHSLPGLALPFFNKRFPSTIPPIVDMCDGAAVRVLSLGINEAKIFPGNARPIIDLPRFTTELSTYARDAADLGIPAIYVGSQPVDESKTRPVSSTGSMIEDDFLEEYDELTRRRAIEDGMPYVDVRTLFGGFALNEVLAEDGYHPNVLGHQVIYLGVQRALAQTGFAID
jgi:hypothetical protein